MASFTSPLAVASFQYEAIVKKETGTYAPASTNHNISNYFLRPLP